MPNLISLANYDARRRFVELLTSYPDEATKQQFKAIVDFVNAQYSLYLAGPQEDAFSKLKDVFDSDAVAETLEDLMSINPADYWVNARQMHIQGGILAGEHLGRFVGHDCETSSETWFLDRCCGGEGNFWVCDGADGKIVFSLDTVGSGSTDCYSESSSDTLFSGQAGVLGRDFFGRLERGSTGGQESSPPLPSAS